MFYLKMPGDFCSNYAMTSSIAKSSLHRCKRLQWYCINVCTRVDRNVKDADWSWSGWQPQSANRYFSFRFCAIFWQCRTTYAWHTAVAFGGNSIEQTQWSVWRNAMHQQDEEGEGERERTPWRFVCSTEAPDLTLSASVKIRVLHSNRSRPATVNSASDSTQWTARVKNHENKRSQDLIN